MTGLSILLCIAAIGFGLASRFRVPLIPLLLIPGMLLSSMGLRADENFLRMTLELGLTFLVFISGIELSPRRFQRRTALVCAIGFAQFLAAASLGYLMARWIGATPLTALYLACALSASSTLVVLRHLRQQKQTFEPFGRLVTGVLLLQDILMILIIVAFSRLDGGWPSMLRGVGWAGVLFLLAVVVQRWVLPWLVRQRRLDEETQLLCMLAVLFGFVGMAWWCDLPPLAGAFFAGLSLSAFPVNGVARGLLGSFATFFMALFFTALGSLLSIPDAATLFKGILLAGVVLLVTPPVVAAIAEWRGVSSRQAIESGLLLAQTSEFSLVLALSGFVFGHMEREVFDIVALVTVLTMALTPVIATDRMTERLLRIHPLRRRITGQGERRGHIVVLGFGAAGMWVVKPLRESGHEVLVVDDDPIIITELDKARIACLRGDGSDEKVLDLAGARNAKLVIASMRRVASARKVLKHLRGVPVIVRLFESSDAEEIRKLGGIPILNSEAAADSFMEWFAKSGAASGTLTPAA